MFLSPLKMSNKQAVGASTLVDFAMVVLVIAVSAYVIVGFFDDSNNQVQSCITGTCVRDVPGCMPETAESTNKVCGPEEGGVCIQSFDDIPKSHNNQACVIDETTQEDENSEETDENERETTEINNGDSSDSSESENGDEPDTPSTVLIEVRKGSIPDEVRDDVDLSSDTTLNIWTRSPDGSVEGMMCKAYLLDDAGNIVESTEKSGQCDYGQYLDAIPPDDTSRDGILEYTASKENINNAESLTVIASLQDNQVASVNLGVRG